MPRILGGDGPIGSPILIVGERPGGDEINNATTDHQLSEYNNFIGRAGDELWARLDRLCHVERDQCRVINLVPTFSLEPPTAAEISRYQHLIEWELRHGKPRFILTVGYHAARWFLPEFQEVTGDVFHGLAFRVSRTVPRWDSSRALVVPSCHSSAALREPEIYQNQLTNDLRAFRAVLDGRGTPHPARVVAPYRVGLAAFGQEGQRLGLDTEGSRRRPECVTLSRSVKEVACVETWDKTKTLTPFLGRAIRHSRIAVHHLKHDWQVLQTLGIDPEDCPETHCTMLQAGLLGYPQSLKVLGFRLFGYRMAEYEDLVQPLDRELVVSTLRSVYVAQVEVLWQTADAFDRQKARRKAAKAKAKAAASGRASDGRPRPAVRGSGRPRQAGDRRLRDSAVGTGSGWRPLPAPAKVRDGGADDGSALPRRALTSIHRICTKPAQATERKRWQASAYAQTVDLPPEPSWKDLPEGIRIPYAMTDAVVHGDVHDRLYPEIKRLGLRTVYGIDKAVIPWIARNETIGLACDKERLQNLSAQLTIEFDAVCAAITDLAGYEVNPISGDQVSDCLFLDRGVTRTKLTKTGKRFTTADKYLKARKNEDILIPKILDARGLNKYIGTYTEKLPGLLVWDEKTSSWRYHPDWKYTRTRTGRWSETIIVLMPKHPRYEGDTVPKQIRDCFYAISGNRLVSCDLSQIEMRVMAHVSQDKVLLDVYRRGLDVHASTAYHVLGAPKRKEDQDESRHRLPAKTFNFSIINDVTEYGLVDQLNEQHSTKANGEPWDVDSVREFREEWFKVHKGVARFFDTQKALGRKHGYVTSMFGRRSQVSSVWSTDDRIRSAGERQCLFGIQSAADDISKIWNKRMWREIIRKRQRQGEYVEPWVRVHDDTILEAGRKQAKAVAAEMLAMVPDLLCIPTTAEAKMGRRWGSLEKLH